MKKGEVICILGGKLIKRRIKMDFKLFVCCLSFALVSGCAAVRKCNVTTPTWERVVGLNGADSDATSIAVGVSSEACLLSGGTFIMQADGKTLRWRCDASANK